MKTLKFVLISVVCLMGSFLYGWVVWSQSPQPMLRLTTDPPLSQIRPFEAEAHTPQSPVRLTVEAMDATGQRLQNSRLHLTLLAPSKTPWFPTDFPLVEGTTVFDIEAEAPTGVMQIQSMLPIRGTYQLQTSVVSSEVEAIAPVQQTFPLAIAESAVKYRNFAILAVILLAVGFGGGWIIGDRQPTQPGATVPERVRLLLSGAILVAIATLLVLNFMAGAANSHSDHAPVSPTAPASQSEAGIRANIIGDRGAIVGVPASLAVEVLDAQTQQPIQDVNLDIAIAPAGEDWVALAFQAMPDTTGTLAWQYQFFDGTPHLLDVVISPQPNSARSFAPIHLSQVIDVEAVEPPLASRLLVLGYLTSLVGAGFGAGFALRRRGQ